MFILYLIFAIFTLSACEDSDEWQVNGDNNIYFDQTLTVLAPDIYATVLERSRSSMADVWTKEGHSFNMEITTFPLEETELHTTRLQTVLMAGQGYDLFFWMGTPSWSQSASGILMDFYELIDQNPCTSREDFFVQVLKAWEINGGLFIFPLAFGFEYIGINSNLPPSIIDRFAEHDIICKSELLKIYIDLHQEYGTHLSLLHYFYDDSFESLRKFLAMSDVGSLIDFEGRISHLNDGRFAEFLENLKKASALMNWSGSTRYELRASFSLGSHPSQYAIKSEHFVFLSQGWFFNPFESPELPFIHFIPLADLYGRPILQTRWAALCVSANGDGPLAWEFIQHLLTNMVNSTDSYHFGVRSMGMPIKRTYFRPHMTEAHQRIFRDDPLGRVYLGIPHTFSEQNFVYGKSFDMLEVLAEMALSISYFPFAIIEDPLQELFIGTRTAQDVADSIHNRMALWLIE